MPVRNGNYGPRNVTSLTAYRILGVAPNDVAAAPKISRLVDKLPEGKLTLLEVLRASDAPEARRFIAIYDDLTLPSYVRRYVPLEGFALAAGLSPTRLWEVTLQAYRKQTEQLGALRAAMHHEQIVDKSSDAALGNEGIEDRMAHLKHMGFLPAAKGSTININANASATAAAQSVATIADLPSPEETIRKMVEARQRASLAGAATKELPAASPAESVPQAFQPKPREAWEPQYVEAKFEDTDDE